jgi:hypothetical protein
LDLTSSLLLRHSIMASIWFPWARTDQAELRYLGLLDAAKRRMPI